MVSAGLVTIVYPFAVFGYALFEECRPGKVFWDKMIRYTLVILFLKFFFQLNFLRDLDGVLEWYNEANVKFLYLNRFIELVSIWIENSGNDFRPIHLYLARSFDHFLHSLQQFLRALNRTLSQKGDRL